MECKFNQDEFCTNNQCPMCGDYCPVPDVEGICKHEERIEEKWKLTPKGCFVAALKNHISIDEDLIDFIWEDFEELMLRQGYVEEN